MTTIELLEYIASERQSLAHCYPLPNPLDCVRYALTELGEYEDAMLRAERTGDKRNHVKPHDARRELGQVGEMIGAALVQLDGWQRVTEGAYAPSNRYDSISVMLESLSKCFWYRADIFNDAKWSFVNWLGLVSFHGWDAHALLVERYAQVREKHCTEAA